MVTNTMVTELRKLFTVAHVNAAKLFRMEGEVSPLWHAVPKHGSHMLISTPWSNDLEKELAMEILRDKFAKLGVERYAFIFEAWAVLGGDPNTILSQRPSKHPDRREMLRIMAEDKHGHVLSGHYFILRPEHKAATLSSFHEDPPDILQVGRMTGLLMTGTRH
jgi:hypothetical protein